MGPGRDEFVRAFKTDPRQIAVQLLRVSSLMQLVIKQRLRFVASRLIDFDTAMLVLRVEEIIEVPATSEATHQNNGLCPVSVFDQRVICCMYYLWQAAFLCLNRSYLVVD